MAKRFSRFFKKELFVGLVLALLIANLFIFVNSKRSCEKISDLQSKNKCYADLANNIPEEDVTNQIQTCNFIEGDSDLEDFCLFRISKKNQDYMSEESLEQLCNMIKGSVSEKFLLDYINKASSFGIDPNLKDIFKMIRSKKKKISMILIILFIVGLSLLILQTHNDDYDQYYKSLNLVTKSSNLDIKKVIRTCPNDPQMKSECLKNVALENAQYDIDKSLELCSMITEELPANECYFQLAETVGNKDVSLAFSICLDSEIFVWLCFSHIANGKLFETGSNLENTLSECDNFFKNVEANDMVEAKIPLDHCKELLAPSIGSYFKYDLDAILSECNQIDDRYKEICFTGFGKAIIDLAIDTKDYTILDKCYEVPPKFIDTCFFSFKHS